MVDYTIVTCWDDEIPRFKAEIIKLCNEGWDLQGGVSISITNNGYRLAQALVKKVWEAIKNTNVTEG
jgi:hypothetical protein